MFPFVLAHVNPFESNLGSIKLGKKLKLMVMMTMTMTSMMKMMKTTFAAARAASTTLDGSPTKVNTVRFVD